jgi:hypothetical protein
VISEHLNGELKHAETALISEAIMWRELSVYRRPKWRPLAVIALVISSLLVSTVASAGHQDLTVAVSEKVPKHLCNRALTNLEVCFYFTTYKVLQIKKHF